MMQTATEATKAQKMAVREADNVVNSAISIHTTWRLGGSVLRQSMFDWKATEMYQELCILETEVKKISMTNNYNIQRSKKVSIMLNWIGREGLRFIQTINEEEQENKKKKQVQGCSNYEVTNSNTYTVKQYYHCNIAISQQSKMKMMKNGWAVSERLKEQ